MLKVVLRVATKPPQPPGSPPEVELGNSQRQPLDRGSRKAVVPVQDWGHQDVAVHPLAGQLLHLFPRYLTLEDLGIKDHTFCGCGGGLIP